MSTEQALDILSRGSSATILALVLVTGFLGYWVFGRTYKEMREDRDAWKAIAQDAVKQNAALVDIMESAKRGR